VAPGRGRDRRYAERPAMKPKDIELEKKVIFEK